MYGATAISQPAPSSIAAHTRSAQVVGVLLRAQGPRNHLRRGQQCDKECYEHWDLIKEATREAGGEMVKVVICEEEE